ncbi:MAG: hypothetical protein IPJ13_19530 [Saprospiraceae bacterium]|nr:hypothetical protein [Saprospiraceae bacterium]
MTTSCACECPAQTLTLNDQSCSLTWSPTACLGYTSVLQRKAGSTWTTVGSAASPYLIPSGQHGEYRLSVTKEGCTDNVSNIINVAPHPRSHYHWQYGHL